MPNVSRRLAAVLATAVAASAMTLLAATGSTSRSAQNRTAYARVLAAPTAANRTNWVLSHSGASAGRPVASRHTPRRSSIAGRNDVDARVRVIQPVDGQLVDAQAGTLGADQQLGVEEPVAVHD